MSGDEAHDGDARGRGPKPLIRVRPLTHDEWEILLRWVKSQTTPTALHRRARVILLSSYEISTYVIAILIPMGRRNVAHWIRRFDADGLAGLLDRPRSGRPRRRGEAS